MARRHHRLGQRHARRANLLVGVGVLIEGKEGKRSNEPRSPTAIERKHRARELRARLHVQDAKFAPDVPVRDALVLGKSRKCCALVHADPPPTNFDVVALIEAIGDPLGGEIREHQQQFTQTTAHAFGGFARLSFLVANGPAVVREIFGRHEVVLASRGADPT
jgi:hypothetical protein